VGVDWGVLFDGVGGVGVGLPTYAFQRERYWLGSIAEVGDVVAAGLDAIDHPLLASALVRPEGQGMLFTGRLSLETHSWLADHAAMGVVLLPGTAFLELALRAGIEVGCDLVEELTLEAPLVFSEAEQVQLQVSVEEPDDSERWTVTIHSRSGNGSNGAQEWTRHASGVLASAGQAVEHTPSEQAQSLRDAWPPQGAQPVEIDGLYERIAEWGFDYGPAFQGVQAVWSREDALFAEVSLPEDQQTQLSRFCVHPALLDAALHPAAIELLGDSRDGAHQSSRGAADGEMRLPFSFNGVRLHASAPLKLRVALSWDYKDSCHLAVADEFGGLVATIESLETRAVSVEQLAGVRGAHGDSLFGLRWIAISQEDVKAPQPSDGDEWVLLGREDSPVAELLRSAGISVVIYPHLAALKQAVQAGVPPRPVLLDTSKGTAEGGVVDFLEQARESLDRVLNVVQEWLVDDGFAASPPLVVLSVDTLDVGPGDDLQGLPGAGVWGLVRSAQSENPGRFLLLDVDAGESSWRALPSAVTRAFALNESQLALRDGDALVPRLTPKKPDDELVPPPDVREWRLDTAGGGSLENLVMIPSPEASAPLGPGQVRVEVRGAGLNFRDVLIALDMYPGKALMGGEGAGIVLEVGPEVHGLTPGDRVMGLFTGGFGPVVVTDQRMLAHVPNGWSLTQAASVPIAFLTAYYALVDLAGVQRGESLLIHAAAGGVGMAATQLARHMGAELFGTASPGKWEALKRLGLDEPRIASSRTLEFKERFLSETQSKGVDVVLNSLTREFMDASFELLPSGGRFIDMGKTDIRDPDEIAAAHPGVAYQAFDLMEAGPERIGEMLGELLKLCESGALEPLPVKTWDVRRASDAFRYMSQARHVGKIVLRIPVGLDPERSVLITGGTGGLGSVLARHLVAKHGVHSLVLAGRRGSEAPGALELKSELEAQGAQVMLAVCDVTDRMQLASLIAAMPDEHPLGAVIHAAGALDDGVIESLTRERLNRALAPKLDGAWHLHELTQHLDLSAFVLFSSVAGTLGGPGQGNYAAANGFLDGLAAYRQARGLAGTSLAWGLWAKPSELTAELSKEDLTRLSRSGVSALSSEEALTLFDAAQETGESLLFPVSFDRGALRAQAIKGTLPTLLSALVRAPVRRTAETTSLARRLVQAPDEKREEIALEFVQHEVATVLGHASLESIDPECAFKEIGFDSLTAVELRNRLNSATGLRLSATLVFDYPTVIALTRHLLSRISGTNGTVNGERSDIRKLIASIPLSRLEAAGLMDVLVKLADADSDQASRVDDGEGTIQMIESMDIDSLVQKALQGHSTD
jgi:polyketide synthase 12